MAHLNGLKPENFLFPSICVVSTFTTIFIKFQGVLDFRNTLISECPTFTFLWVLLRLRSFKKTVRIDGKWKQTDSKILANFKAIC